MDLIEAEVLARQLMQKHGLNEWRFGWDRAKRRFGCCWPSRKLITLSKPVTELNHADEVRDTILHEIAHALAPGGHSRAWREKCIQIGARPQRCYSRHAVQLPELRQRNRYIARCGCPIVHCRTRKPKRTYICRKCRSRLIWFQSEIAD